MKKEISLLWLLLSIVFTFLIAYFKCEQSKTYFAVDISSSEKLKESVPFAANKHDQTPFAIVHVGPHKTASTTIQALLGSLTNALTKDNYYIPQRKHLPGKGKYMNGPEARLGHHNNLAICLQNLSGCDQSLWPAFINFTQDMAKQQKNIVISAEGLSEITTDIQKLSKLLTPFRVKIVVVYRHFHEKIVSGYNQRYKSVACKSRVPTFAEWLTNPIIDEIFVKYTTSIIKRYQEYFDDIAVLNFHDQNFLKDFFCKMIPNANNTCDEVNKTKTQAKTNRNEGTHNYEMLTYRAFERELKGNDNGENVCKKIAQALSNITRHELNTEQAKFPQKCVSQDIMDRVSVTSLEAEQVVAKDWFNITIDRNVRIDEIKDVVNRTYCSIDISKVLREKSWQSLLLDQNHTIPLKA